MTAKAILVSLLLTFLIPLTAQARPTRSYPAWWLQQAACIRSHEGAWGSATGNGYEGAYQFTLSTWRAVGGSVTASGHWAASASPAEQTYRAWLNWRANGGRWGGGQWPTSARLCGVA